MSDVIIWDLKNVDVSCFNFAHFETGPSTNRMRDTESI